MKKPLILFVVLFLFFMNVNSFAQLTMTHGDVYNYNVGDVFLIRSYCDPVPGGGYNPIDTLFEKTTILNKYVSLNSDTVFYTCLVKTKYVQSFTPWAQPPYFTITYHTLTDTLFYT